MQITADSLYFRLPIIFTNSCAPLDVTGARRNLFISDAETEFKRTNDMFLVLHEIALPMQFAVFVNNSKHYIK
jgi:hypothetical protein